jgi:hypothetical protein
MKKTPVNLKLIYITAHSVGLVATQIKSVEVRLVFRTSVALNTTHLTVVLYIIVFVL